MSLKTNNIIKDGVMAILSAFLLQVIGLYGFIAALFFFAVPLIVYATTRGEKYATGAVLITGALLLGIMDWQSAFTFSIIALFFVLFVPYAFKKKMSSYRAIFLSSLVLLGMTLGVNLLLQQQSDISLISNLENTMRDVITMQIEALKASGLDSIELLDLEYALRTALRMMVQAIPGIFFALSFITSLIHYSVSAWLLRYTGYGIMDAGRFNRFRLPNNIIVGALLTLASTYFMGLFGFPYTEALYLNLTIGFGIFFLIQGLAVVDCFMARRFRLISRILLPVFLIVFLQLGFAFLLIGILDVGFKFRDRITYTRGE